jgi:hypothetical protein
MIHTKQPSTTQNVVDSTSAWCEGIAAGRRILEDVDSLCERPVESMLYRYEPDRCRRISGSSTFRSMSEPDVNAN